MSNNYAAVPPGWYDDPKSPGQRRYWDGSAWTEHRTSLEAGSPKKPLSRASMWWILGAVVAALAGGIALASIPRDEPSAWTPPEGFTKMDDEVAIDMTTDPGAIIAYAHHGCMARLDLWVDVTGADGQTTEEVLVWEYSVGAGKVHHFPYSPWAKSVKVNRAVCI